MVSGGLNESGTFAPYSFSKLDQDRVRWGKSSCGSLYEANFSGDHLMGSDQAGTELRYWLLVGSVPSGPYTTEQVHAKLASGEVTGDTRACRLGDSRWLPLIKTPSFGPSSRQANIPSLARIPPTAIADSNCLGPAAKEVEASANIRESRQATTTKKTEPDIKSGSRVGWAGGAGTILVIVVMALARSSATTSKVLTSVLTPATTQPLVSTTTPVLVRPAPGTQSFTPAKARINVAATDGTATLQALVARLPPAQVQVLGLGVLVTGVDVYGIKVRISNTGTASVRVFPGNLRIHFGQDTVGVMTANHPLFLQPCIVQPGNYVEGLVMYEAAVDVGAVIRLLGTSFSYDDSSITVTYGP